MRSAHWCLVPVVAGALVGCANIHAKKVPVEDRIAGTDNQKGFRYYLSRPYVVIAKAVPIATETEEVELVEVVSKRDKNVSQLGFRSRLPAPGRPGTSRLYDRSGKPLNLDEWEEGTGYKARMLQPKGGENNAMLPQLKLAPQEDTPPAGDGTGTDAPPGIQVVMLPDFEEQYAIRNHNVAAKSAYDLHFTDGWQLESVNGTWNATEIPVRLLQSISKVIKAAEVLQLQTMQSAPARTFAAPQPFKMNAAGAPVVVRLVRSYYLEPGIYRIQKSWERQECEVHSIGAAAGLLSDLGLEVRQTVRIDSAPEIR